MKKIIFEKIHYELGNDFFDIANPANVNNGILRYRNLEAAKSLGLDGINKSNWCKYFCNFDALEKNDVPPLVLKYHGHQFGVYNSDIGDGRGFLLAQIRDIKTNKILDLGTKGSGRTLYSRDGDGKLTLKGAYREILATEMLSALNVPTSQTFSVIETKEMLFRNDEPSPARSAILIRLLNSHIRIGTFQRLSFLGQRDNLEKLLRHVIEHHYIEIDFKKNIEELIPIFLHEFMKRVADMVSGWMVSGFVHGVMNTDNFNITGESFDFGPWRFLKKWNLNFVAAYFDQNGRYSYGRQPEAALWALCRFGDCFVPFVSSNKLEEILNHFYEELEKCISRRLMWRLGFEKEKKEKEILFSRLFFKVVKEKQFEWNKMFFDLYAGNINLEKNEYLKEKDCEEMLEVLREFKSRHIDLSTPKKMLKFKDLYLDIDNVELVWNDIYKFDDWNSFYRLIRKIRNFKKILLSN